MDEEITLGRSSLGQLGREGLRSWGGDNHRLSLGYGMGSPVGTMIPTRTRTRVGLNPLTHRLGYNGYYGNPWVYIPIRVHAVQKRLYLCFQKITQLLQLNLALYLIQQRNRSDILIPY